MIKVLEIKVKRNGKNYSRTISDPRGISEKDKLNILKAEAKAFPGMTWRAFPA